MKLTKIAAACAALCTSQVYAFGPTTAPDLEVVISGASAQQKTLGAIIAGMMSPGFDVYYDTGTGGTDGSKYRAYFGSWVDTSVTPSVTRKLLVHNRADGGSVFGVNPVARATLIDVMKIGSNCAAVPGAVSPATTYKCNITGTGLVQRVPDAGVSDVEPGMFTGINVAAGDDELTPAERSNLKASSQLAVVFGVGQTNNFPVGFGGFSKAQVNSLLTGTYYNWEQVPGAGGAGPVVICRRVNGSGTQATFNAYFQGYGCSSSPQLPADASYTEAGVYEVNEFSTSGGVKGCLDAAFNAGKRAIGVLSTENQPAASNHYVFAKLDGQDATVLNATKGVYDFYSEQSFQWRNKTVNGVAQPTGSKLAFLTSFLSRSGDPAITNTIAGVAALPSRFVATDPAGWEMRGSRGGNTCAATQLGY